MALDGSVTMAPGLTDALIGAAAAWELEAEQARGRAKAIRDDVIDQALRVAFPTEESRTQTLGRMYANAERLALQEDEKAAAYTARAKTARERNLYLDTADFQHNAKYGDLFKAATDAGRVLLQQTGSQAVVFFPETAPDSWFGEVEAAWQRTHGIPRSGFVKAIQQRDEAAFRDRNAPFGTAPVTGQ